MGSIPVLKKYDATTQEHVYEDLLTEEETREKIFPEKLVKECRTCINRAKAIKELIQIEERDGAFVREKHRTYDKSSKEPGFRERLKECRACNKPSNITRTTTWNYTDKNGKERKAHEHRCGPCGTRTPADPKAWYKGDFVDDDLDQKKIPKVI